MWRSNGTAKALARAECAKHEQVLAARQVGSVTATAHLRADLPLPVHAHPHHLQPGGREQKAPSGWASRWAAYCEGAAGGPSHTLSMQEPQPHFGSRASFVGPPCQNVCPPALRPTLLFSSLLATSSWLICSRGSRRCV